MVVPADVWLERGIRLAEVLDKDMRLGLLRVFR
jgi:hypothetical protein